MKHAQDHLERARQAELDSLRLEEFAGKAFEDIARMARDVCKTPVVLVSIVDGDRQWFMADIGLGAKETPRAISFCTHAIQTPGEMMVVEDATKDPRFADNPLVVGKPRIRFYASAPLVMRSGLVMGTVCAIDTEPRKIDAAQIEEMQFLASQAVAVLERCKSARPRARAPGSRSFDA